MPCSSVYKTRPHLPLSRLMIYSRRLLTNALIQSLLQSVEQQNSHNIQQQSSDNKQPSGFVFPCQSSFLSLPQFSSVSFSPLSHLSFSLFINLPSHPFLICFHLLCMRYKPSQNHHLISLLFLLIKYDSQSERTCYLREERGELRVKCLDSRGRRKYGEEERI